MAAISDIVEEDPLDIPLLPGGVAVMVGIDEPPIDEVEGIFDDVDDDAGVEVGVVVEGLGPEPCSKGESRLSYVNLRPLLF